MTDRRDDKHHDNDPTAVERPRSGQPSPTHALEDSPAEPPPSPTAFDPPDDGARYAERGELGRGGMGRVADAFDVALGRDVAIKHMLSTDVTSVSRFEREARVTARLEHPSIVPLYDAGRNPDGTPFYVMRKVDGRPLDQIVAEKAQLADRIALVPNVLAACDAVAFAHARHIIHRDIKPTNILVGAFGETLLIDWGLAREIENHDAASSMQIANSDVGALTRAGTVAGTPGFMSPEQARGEDTDARADVFALGATLFYILACEPPYAASGSGTAMITQVAADRPPDWTRLPTDVPADLRAIVVKSMASRPDDRYPDAGALAADLRHFVTGNLVGAHRYGTLEQLRRWVRRHRGSVIVATASAIILAVIATIAVRRVIAERDEATLARDAETTARALAETRQREALDRVDDQLVAHAASLGETDPVGAIATLRKLRPGSERWRTAAAVLEAIRYHGIPYGFTQVALPYRASIDPSSRYAFTLDNMHQLVLYELATRKRTVLRTDIDHMIASAWIGDRIAIIDNESIRMIDLRGAVVETIATPVRAHEAHWSEVGRVWIVAEVDHQVYELNADHTWRAMIANVEDLIPDRELDRAVFRRGASLIVWSRTEGERIISPFVGPLTATFGRTWVAFQRGEEVEQWALRPTLQRMHTWHARNVLLLESIHDTPIAFTEGRLVAFQRDGGIWTMTVSPEIVTRSDHGTMVLRDDGGIELYDDKGSIQIGRGTTRFRTTTWSRDGRFVVALSDARDVVIYDLEQFRPRVHVLEGTEQLLALDGTSIWHMHPGYVSRRDLATDKETVIIDGMVIQDLTISLDGRWLSMLEASTSLVLDTVRKTGAKFDGTPARLVRDDAVLVADGPTVKRWNAATPDGADVVTFPFTPQIIVGNDTELIATDHRISRYNYATKQFVEIAHVDEIEYAAVSADGRLYIIVKGVLFFVEGTEIKPVETPHPCDGTYWANEFLVVRCANVLFEVDELKTHAIASDVRDWATDLGLVLYQRAHQEIALIDRPTGIHIPIGVRVAQNTHVFVRGTRFVVVAADGMRDTTVVLEYTFDAAQTEAELRDRLARATNIVELAGGVAWPDH